MTLEGRSDLEVYVLGALISNNGKEVLATRLIVDDFSKPEHKEIFILILKRLSEGQAISYEAISVDSSLSSDATIAMSQLAFGQWNEATLQDVEKAVKDLVMLSDNTFSADMLGKIEKAIRKNMNLSREQILSNVSAITTVLMGRHRMNTDMPLGDAIAQALDLALKRQGEGKMKFGYYSIDSFTNGFRRGEVIVIGARTNVGKSMLCLHPALENARNGHKVLMCLNEMDGNEMSLRLLSKISKTDIGVLTGDRQPSSVDLDAIDAARAEMETLKILFRDKVKTVAAIESSLAVHKAIGDPVDVLILDHFNKLTDDTGKYRKTNEFLAEAFQRIYELAKQYNCTMIVMTQINREGALADKVTIEHLKGTGSLEEDPDKVFLMYGDKNDPDGRILYLAKNRFGKKDQEFFLHMKGHIMTLEDGKDGYER